MASINIDLTAAPFASFADQSGPDLVRHFNAMAAEANHIGLIVYKPVTRFASLEAGVRRCEQLRSSLMARIQSEAAVSHEEAKQRSVQRMVNETMAEATVSHSQDQQGNLVDTITETLAGDPATTPEAQAPDTESEDNMAKKAGKSKAKAAKATKAPKKAATPRAPRENAGPTLRDQMNEYNELAKQARDLGLNAKHHTSTFETRDKGVVQIEKLQKAIKEAQKAK